MPRVDRYFARIILQFHVKTIVQSIVKNNKVVERE